MKLTEGLFFVLLAVVFSLSCDSDLLPENAPKIIDADGQIFLACEGSIRVSSQEGASGASYSIRFTEKGGLAHDVRGIKKLHISDIPKDQRSLCQNVDQSQNGQRSQLGYPDCKNGYVLYSEVRSYANEHSESIGDVGARILEHGCKIVDSLPSH